jgi:diguanylate cyclase (GGDEF)-like protein
LTTATSSRGSNGRKHAFFLIDLNDFKRINDLHGHAFGDRVLQAPSEEHSLSDLLARLGGDEFALLCYDVDRDAALAIGHRFIAALEGEIRAGGYSHIIGASIGAVLIPDDGANAEEVIHHADLATYRAKGQDQSNEPSGNLLWPPSAQMGLARLTSGNDY